PLRGTPDPVALNRGFSCHASIVLLVPANGIEQELTILCASIFQRLASNGIMRDLGNKLRLELLEFIGILAVSQPEAFKRASGESRTGHRLLLRRSLECFKKVGRRDASQVGVRRSVAKHHLGLALQLVSLPRRSDLIRRVQNPKRLLLQNRD